MNPLINKLRAAHDELETLTRDVARTIRADERQIMHDDFAVLERKLLDHMSWEEMYILPTYERDFPDSAAQIRIAHADFRARLGEIGLAIDLHSVRADAFDRLAEELRAHAHGEEVMYSTVSESLPGEEVEAINNLYDRFRSLLEHLPRAMA